MSQDPRDSFMDDGDVERAPRVHGALFPPALVPSIRRLVPGHAAIRAMPDAELADLLTAVFFASLETEEQLRHPLRIAFVGPAREGSIPDVHDPSGVSSYRWRFLAFRDPVPFEGRSLLRLSRAAESERLFVVVSTARGPLEIAGLAREGFRVEEDPVLKVVSESPGRLEIWSGPRRVLEYVGGSMKVPAESILLAGGPVRRSLLDLAREERVGIEYNETVARLVRSMSAHGFGGILAIRSEPDPELRGEDGGFLVDADVPLCAMLRALSRYDGTSRPAARADDPDDVIRQALRAEVDRVIAEVGRLTALDGATVLDRSLGVRGFGIVLPLAADSIVVQAKDPEGRALVPFDLQLRGARHRAAASYAHAHPGAAVFIASADGDIGCMVRSPGDPHVVMWRFRRGDLELR